jgi:uncharacterized membrane protein YhaH (DUF805 family)
MQPNTDQWGQPIQPDPQPMLVGAPQPMVVGGVDPGMMTGRPAQMMGFIDSVKSVMMNNFANFEGRSSRSEYWWFFLFTFIINIAISIVDMAVSIALGHETADTVWCGLILIYYLIFFIPSLSVGVRRMHDLGKSGWWILITAIPCIGIILYIVWVASEGEPHDNAYGPVPTNVLAPNLL